jgi:hypothetical protein
MFAVNDWFYRWRLGIISKRKGVQKESVLTKLTHEYPQTLYLTLPDCNGRVHIGDIAYFTSNKKSIRLVEYTRGRIIDVGYPPQLTFPTDPVLESKEV